MMQLKFEGKTVQELHSAVIAYAAELAPMPADEEAAERGVANENLPIRSNERTR